MFIKPFLLPQQQQQQQQTRLFEAGQICLSRSLPFQNEDLETNYYLKYFYKLPPHPPNAINAQEQQQETAGAPLEATPLRLVQREQNLINSMVVLVPPSVRFPRKAVRPHELGTRW